jgi:hypothetical protein
MHEHKVTDDDGNEYWQRDEPIHPWRWRGLVIWIIIFTVVIFVSLRTQRGAVHRLQEDKASIASLQDTISELRRTDCALRRFLLKAREARLKTAESEYGELRQADLDAARGYLALANIFPERVCQ